MTRAEPSRPIPFVVTGTMIMAAVVLLVPPSSRDKDSAITAREGIIPEVSRAWEQGGLDGAERVSWTSLEAPTAAVTCDHRRNG